MAILPAYSEEQVGQFLEHIGFPERLRKSDKLRPSPALLTALHTHTITTLPYENLSIHYSPEHSINLDPQHLFRKIVLNKRGRGGYCMENAILYNHILRAMGFDAYTAGARTRHRIEGVPQGDFPGWWVLSLPPVSVDSSISLSTATQKTCMTDPRGKSSDKLVFSRVHIVNIITFDDGSKWHDDVAFGGDGPIMPIPLIDDERPHRNLGAQQVRLVRDWLSTQVHRTEATKLWIYQYRNGDDASLFPWNSFYAFTELEFMAADWEVVNWWTGGNPSSHHISRPLVVRFLSRPLQDGGHNGSDDCIAPTVEVYGKHMLVGAVVKENLGGKTKRLMEFATEDERVQGLQELFDISLLDEEKASMRGWPTSLLMS